MKRPDAPRPASGPDPAPDPWALGDTVSDEPPPDAGRSRRERPRPPGADRPEADEWALGDTVSDDAAQG